MSEIKELRIAIERLRTEMYEAYQKDSTNEEVLAVSERLDQVINEYMKLIRQLNRF